MSDKKSISVQEDEILMEQIKNCLYLYNKGKISYRNAWSKFAEKLDFIQNVIYKCRYEKLSDCCACPVAKNRKVRASLSVTKTRFLKRVSFFEMKGATID